MTNLVDRLTFASTNDLGAPSEHQLAGVPTHRTPLRRRLRSCVRESARASMRPIKDATTNDLGAFSSTLHVLALSLASFKFDGLRRGSIKRLRGQDERRWQKDRELRRRRTLLISVGS